MSSGKLKYNCSRCGADNEYNEIIKCPKCGRHFCKTSCYEFHSCKNK